MISKEGIRRMLDIADIELKKAAEAVAKAISDPEARLRAMFNAKIRGDM